MTFPADITGNCEVELRQEQTDALLPDRKRLKDEGKRDRPASFFVALYNHDCFFNLVAVALT